VRDAGRRDHDVPALGGDHLLADKKRDLAGVDSEALGLGPPMEGAIAPSGAEREKRSTDGSPGARAVASTASKNQVVCELLMANPRPRSGATEAG